MADQNDHKDLDGGNHQSPDSHQRNTVVSIILSFAIIAFVLGASHIGSRMTGHDYETIATSAFVTAVKEDRVGEVTYKASEGSLTGTFWHPGDDTDDKSDMKYFKSTYVGSDSLQELMADHPDVLFRIDTSSSELLETLIATFVPTLLVILAMLYLMNQIQGQNGSAMKFGRADKARTDESTRPKYKFSDVAGIDEAVEELQSIIETAEDENVLAADSVLNYALCLAGAETRGLHVDQVAVLLIAGHRKIVLVLGNTVLPPGSDPSVDGIAEILAAVHRDDSKRAYGYGVDYNFFTKHF